jgi:hypothetical protein
MIRAESVVEQRGALLILVDDVRANLARPSLDRVNPRNFLINAEVRLALGPNFENFG